MEDVVGLLDRAAIIVANTVFVKEYIARTPLEDRKILGLGIALSKWTSWTGYDIMKVAIAALEDANFHEWAEILQGLLDNDDLNGEDEDTEHLRRYVPVIARK